jgi:hypothetical protein
MYNHCFDLSLCCTISDISNEDRFISFICSPFVWMITSQFHMKESHLVCYKMELQCRKSLVLLTGKNGNVIPLFIWSGEEGEASAPGAAVAVAAQQRVNRRKTDLMPTIPSPRDITPTSSSRPSSVYLQGNRPFSRSPGRAYSMSRLDQLSQPRRRPAAELASLHEKTHNPATLGSSPTTAKSMSCSMSHLAGSKQSQRGSQLCRSDASRSMSQLTGSGQGYPVPPPRSTRAERLRQRAREVAHRSSTTSSAGQLQGKCS